MPYYIVKKWPVFLHSRLHKELEKEALRNWSALDRIGARIEGQKANEAQTLVSKLLDEKSISEEFYSTYVQFDLTGEEAQANVWDLLYDFCHLSGSGQLIDVRSFENRLVADYQGEAYSFPMGRVFELQFPIQLRKKTRSFWKPKPLHTFRIPIDTSNVNRLRGDLNAFTVSMKSQTLQFEERGVLLLPPNK